MLRIPPLAPITVAALAILSPAGAAAQSNVTFYGLIDSGLSYVDNGDAGATLRQQSGVSQGSRWGFTRSEDLGGGNQANFVLEGGIFNDTGAMTGNGGFSRRSIVGLSGAWGALDVGRDYNPVHTMLAQFDPLANGLLSASSGFMGNAGAQMPNAVFYTTPDLNGVTAKVGYSLGERAAAGRSGDSLSSRVVLARGRLAWYAYLSRRTTLYANVAKIVNRNGQKFAFVDAGKNVYGYTLTSGERANPVGIVIGVQHKF